MCNAKCNALQRNPFLCESRRMNQEEVVLCCLNRLVIVGPTAQWHVAALQLVPHRRVGSPQSADRTSRVLRNILLHCESWQPASSEASPMHSGQWEAPSGTYRSVGEISHLFLNALCDPQFFANHIECEPKATVY